GRLRRAEWGAVRRDVGELGAGEVQHLLDEVVREAGFLTGGLGEVPAVDDRFGGAYVRRPGARYRADRDLVDPLQHARFGKRREEALRGRALGLHRVVAENVGDLRVESARRRGRLPAEDGREQAVADDEVVDQLPHVPVGARGRAVPLAG